VAALAPVNLLVGFALFFLLTVPGLPDRSELQGLLEAQDAPEAEAAVG
jgi:hypothetical protein